MCTFTIDVRTCMYTRTSVNMIESSSVNVIESSETTQGGSRESRVKTSQDKSRQVKISQNSKISQTSRNTKKPLFPTFSKSHEKPARFKVQCRLFMGIHKCSGKRGFYEAAICEILEYLIAPKSDAKPKSSRFRKRPFCRFFDLFKPNVATGL